MLRTIIPKIWPKVFWALAVPLLAVPLAWCQSATSQSGGSANRNNSTNLTIVEGSPVTPGNEIVMTNESISRPSELAIMTLRVNKPTNVQSKTVAPGTYMLVVNGDNMTLQNLSTNKVVAEAPVKWTEAGRTFNNTRLDIGQNDVLTKIDVGGTNQAIELQSSVPNASSNSPASGD